MKGANCTTLNLAGGYAVFCEGCMLIEEALKVSWNTSPWKVRVLVFAIVLCEQLQSVESFSLELEC